MVSVHLVNNSLVNHHVSLLNIQATPLNIHHQSKIDAKVIGTSSNPQIAEFVRKWSMDEVGDVSRDVFGDIGVLWGGFEDLRSPFGFVGRGQVFLVGEMRSPVEF